MRLLSTSAALNFKTEPFAFIFFLQVVKKIKNLEIGNGSNLLRSPTVHGRVLVVKLVHAMKWPLIVGPLALPSAVSDTSAEAKQAVAVGSLIFNELRHAGNCGTGSPCLLVCPEEKLATSGGVGSFFFE